MHNIFALFQDVPKTETVIYSKLKLASNNIKISMAVETEQDATLPTKTSKGFSVESIERANHDACQLKRNYIEYIVGELLDLTVFQVRELNSYTKYLGKSFEEFMFECQQHVYSEKL